MRLIMVTLLASLTMACFGKFERAEIADRAQTELIGMSKKDVFLCAGVPEHEEKVDDLEFLTYDSGGDSSSVGHLSNNTAVIATHRLYCEVTFVLKDGAVTKVNYQGRTGGLATKGEQCAFVVENCLKKQ